MAWNPTQYLKFADDRRRPAIDLLARIALDAPRAIVDLGCGAGNVTRFLAERWPMARVTGVDSSPSMLARARSATAGDSRFEWIEGDIAGWSARGDAPDLVFSNAALHWIDDHAALLPRLLHTVSPGGVLAVQMPDNFGAPAHAALFETARSAPFAARLAGLVRDAPVASAATYHAWLAPEADGLDIWTTEYLHVLATAADGEHPVVAWMSSTAMTPFTGALDTAQSQAFVAAFRARVAALYPALADGTVLFPFRRRFIVASRAKR